MPLLAMSYTLSCLSLLLVAYTNSIDAWVALKPFLTTKQSRPNSSRIPQQLSSSPSEQPSAFSTDDPFHGISHLIDDGKGNIRSDLATSIWNWDHEHRSQNSLPKFEYSTRQGLRLVEEISRELLETTTRNVNKAMDEDHTITAYSDLVQEGVVALMYAMTKFDATQQDETFEQYARRHIISSLSKSLAQESGPIRLPGHVFDVLKRAEQAKRQLQDELNAQPTLQQVATKLEIVPEKLQLYQLLAGKALSVERTMEILDPVVDTSSVTFEDSAKWQEQHGEMMALERGDSFEEQDGEEGEDEMWFHQEQIAAPLRDMIVDSEEPTPDDLLLRKMIHDDVEDFLTRTLNERELEVIHMRFGLEDGRVHSLLEVGQFLGVTASRVAQIEEQAMDKLRSSYTNRNIEPYLDEEHDRFDDARR